MQTIQPFNYSRTFNAPRALVYELHTKAEHVVQWFGPAGMRLSKFDMHFHVGGINHYCLEIPGGIEMWGRQVYQEIVPNEKIVHIQSFSDKDGGITSHPMAPTWPREMLATTTFEDDGAGTKVTLSWLPHNADAAGDNTFDMARDTMTGGFKGMFDTLESYIAKL